MKYLSELNIVVQTKIEELQEEAKELQVTFDWIFDTFFNDSSEINSLEFDIETEFDDGDVITFITKAKLNGEEIFGEDTEEDWDEFLDNIGTTSLAGDLRCISEGLIYIYHGKTESGIILKK